MPSQLPCQRVAAGSGTWCRSMVPPWMTTWWFSGSIVRHWGSWGPSEYRFCLAISAMSSATTRTMPFASWSTQTEQGIMRAGRCGCQVVRSGREVLKQPSIVLKPSVVNPFFDFVGEIPSRFQMISVSDAQEHGPLNLSFVMIFQWKKYWEPLWLPTLWSRKSGKHKLEPDNEEEKPSIKKDADSSDGASDQEGHGKDKDDTGESGLVREIRYKLETLNFKINWGAIILTFQKKRKGKTSHWFPPLMYPRNNFALKERNLSVRNLIWVFDPVPWQKTSSIFRFLNQDQDNSFPSQPGLSFKGVGLLEEGWKHLRPSDHQQLEEQHLSLHQGMEDRCDPFCPDAAPQCHDETGAGIRLDINCLFRGGMTVFVSKPLVRTNHACDRKLRSKDLAILSCVFKRFMSKYVILARCNSPRFSTENLFRTWSYQTDIFYCSTKWFYSLVSAPCIPGYPSKGQLASHGTGLYGYSRTEAGFLQYLKFSIFAQTGFWPQHFTGESFNPPIPPQTAARTEVAGGTSFVRKTLESFSVPTVQSCVMMDLVAYDGWPSLASIEDHSTFFAVVLLKVPFKSIPQDWCTEWMKQYFTWLVWQELAEGKNFVCGCVSLENSGSDLVTRIANEVYNGCRAGRLNLSGFPTFDPILQALKTSNVTEREKAFRVTVQQHNKLLILESLAKRWLDHEHTREQAEQVINDHNKEYNEDGEFLAADRSSLTRTVASYFGDHGEASWSLFHKTLVGTKENMNKPYILHHQRHHYHNYPPDPSPPHHHHHHDHHRCRSLSIQHHHSLLDQSDLFLYHKHHQPQSHPHQGHHHMFVFLVLCNSCRDCGDNFYGNDDRWWVLMMWKALVFMVCADCDDLC